MSAGWKISQIPPRPTRFSESAKPFCARLDETTTAAIERGFAARVRTHLNGQILRYSDRLELLRAAERLRIERFRANLIIATVQHEMAGATAGTPLETRPARSQWRVSSIIAAVVVTELATVALTWFVWRA
jgi:hypothetical protein